MNKREAILFLEKKRDKAIGDMSFFDEGSRKGLMNEIRVNTYDIAINTLQQIDEPQAEKVEVPDYVAEWYEVNKGNLEFNIASAFHRIGRNTHNPQHSIYEWLNDSNNEPMQTLFKMKDGYTVKPKRWVVKLPETGKYFANISYGKMFGMIAEISEREAKDAYPFTDRAKAEAVAVLVEGSVEEV